MGIRQQLEFIPTLQRGLWAYQQVNNKIYVRQYERSGYKGKREFFGHRFLVDFENRTLIPTIG